MTVYAQQQGVSRVADTAGVRCRRGHVVGRCAGEDISRSVAVHRAAWRHRGDVSTQPGWCCHLESLRALRGKMEVNASRYDTIAIPFMSSSLCRSDDEVRHTNDFTQRFASNFLRRKSRRIDTHVFSARVTIKISERY